MTDRELDAMVAEHIMKRCPHPLERLVPAGTSEDSPLHCLQCHRDFQGERLPHYSTDVWDAFKVVDTVAAEGYSFTLHKEPTDWSAHFGRNSAWAATPAEAICRAALRTRGPLP